MINDMLIKLIEKRSKLAEEITGNDPEKLHGLSEWLDLCIEINQTSPNYTELTTGNRKIELKEPEDDLYIPIEEEGKEPLFQLPDETPEERIEKRDKKIQENLNNVKVAWKDFKSEIDKLQEKRNKAKSLDRKVYAICGGGVIICAMLLLIMELAK